MKKKTNNMRFTCLAFCVALAACGGGNDNSGNATGPNNPSTPQAAQGVFVDAPVGGLHYVSGSLSGTTDAAGHFNYVPGLAVTLDPSHFIFGSKKAASWDPILKYVAHVHLRDTKPDVFQVRIGQGNVEYGKLVSLLQRAGYTRALCAHMPPLEGVDQVAELRKMRLLLESLL